MNIDDHVSGIVQSLVDQMSAQVQTQIAQLVEQKITEAVGKIDIESMLSDQLDKKLSARVNQLPIDKKSIESQLTKRLDDLAVNISAAVQTASISSINEAVAKQINNLEFNSLAEQGLIRALEQNKFAFKPASIPASALDLAELSISADSINGGIAKNFGSTGIDDKATVCQLSIFDDITVIENNLLTKDLTVKGKAVIEGDLEVTGTVPTDSGFYRQLSTDITNTVRSGLDTNFFKGYAQTVFDIIRDQGIDLAKLTVGGRAIVDGNNLSPNITASNLQRLGQLQELQVSGESLLSGSLYTTQKRVGINTIEPASALSIWDQEIEVGIGKRSSNTAVIGTPRKHNLVLSSNDQDNLVLNTDGSVAVTKLAVGSVSLSSSDRPPADDQPKGTIVFNSNPSLGGPMGWISLGDARWANFGIID